MDTDEPVTPDVQLPGQQAGAVDLEPSIQPEGEQPGSDPVEGNDDPEVGNTLISPENS